MNYDPDNGSSTYDLPAHGFSLRRMLADIVRDSIRRIVRQWRRK